MQITAIRTALRVVLGLSLSLLVTGITGETRHVAGASANANIAIDAGSPRGTISPTAFGMNTAVWDGHLLDGSMPSVLRRAGVTILRFPGGSSADNYHWQTNSFCNGGYTNPNNTFDAFMGVARATGAQPLITVNYGSNATCTGGGDPAEAAAWVRYANVTKGYGVKYWEIGNEVYGNGTYPGGWETDLHPQKGPAAYASNTAAFVDAMKAADPSIKVGVALTTPGYWPDGRAPAWNTAVLDGVCAKIDFVDVHWYPINDAGTDADLLASTGQIAGMMATLRAAITAHCGARANQIQILLGEMNTNSTGKQRVGLVDALFLADGFMTWLEDGAANTSWWDLHNGIDLSGNNSPSLYGAATYGDLGVLSSGGSAGGVSEPPVNTPFPPYYGLQMLTKLGMPGDTMVAASSDQALVTAHAVRQANGNLALMLVNKSPDTTYNVALSLSGYSPASTATIYSYGMQSSTISARSVLGIGNAFAQSIPPYSLTTVVMMPPSSTPASTVTPPGIPDTATPTSTAPAIAASTATNTATNTPTSTPPAIAASTATNTPASTATPPSIPDTATPTSGGAPMVSIGTSSTALTIIAPGETETLAATVTSTIPLAGAIVDFYVYDASGHLVTQIWQSPVVLAANTPQTVRASWSVPAHMAPGTYTLKVGVFGTGWSPLYAWNDAAATVMVGASTPSLTATSTATNTPTSTPPAIAASTATNTATNTPTSTPPAIAASTATNTPASTATPPSIPDTATPTSGGAPMVSIGTSSTALTIIAPGETETLAATVTSTIPLAGAIVDFYVYDASGHLVTQIWQSPVVLAANTPQTVRASWSVPAHMAPGTYTLKVGVFGTGWSPLYAWNDAAATLTISMATSAPPFNNNGISSDRTPAVARFDAYDDSYSTQALQSSGLTPGQQIVVHGVTFPWPNVAPGAPDNIVAHGQTIRLAAPAAAATLAFLGAASNGPSTGTGTVTYADGSTQNFALGFSDWTLNGGVLTPSYGNSIAATLPYRNQGTSREPVKTHVFYAAVPLRAGKTIASVTLPTTVSQGQLHVFTLSLSNTAQP
jgi:hypothetical protein